MSAPGSPGRRQVLAPGFEALAAAFDGQLARGLHHGAQIQVRLRGELVLDRWGGIAELRSRRPVLAGTPFLVYSATKPLTAACVHRLVDEGRIELAAPAAEYWPGFGRRGKAGITVDQLLLHQAGIPGEATAREALAWLLPRGGARRAARARPIHAPGEECRYHAFSAGFVLGEIIRRLTRLSPAAYLRESFLGPLGMADSFAGLPPAEYGRASRVYAGDPGQASAALLFSNRPYRALYLPAASLNTTAGDLATFYEMLLEGGGLGGRRCLSERRVREATALAFDGLDAGTGRRVRWARGFSLGGFSPFPGEEAGLMGSGSSELTFGGSGQGGCAIGWADPPSGLVFAFVCNRLLGLEAAHRRFRELADEAWKAAGRGRA